MDLAQLFSDDLSLHFYNQSEINSEDNQNVVVWTRSNTHTLLNDKAQKLNSTAASESECGCNRIQILTNEIIFDM